MKTLRVIEATKEEIVAAVENMVGEAAAKADQSNPKGKKTAKEREAHDLVATALQTVVDLLKDWKIVEATDDPDEPPTTSSSNGSVTQLAGRS